MILQNCFVENIKFVIKNCYYYCQNFKGKKRKTTIEGAFGYNTVNRVSNKLKTILKPTQKKKQTVYNYLRECSQKLNSLAIELDCFDKKYWSSYIRQLVIKLVYLLPDSLIQMALFDDTEYTNKVIESQPVFRCFQEWLREFKNRNKSNLDSHIKNCSYSKKKEPSYYQLCLLTFSS